MSDAPLSQMPPQDPDMWEPPSQLDHEELSTDSDTDEESHAAIQRLRLRLDMMGKELDGFIRHHQNSLLELRNELNDMETRNVGRKNRRTRKEYQRGLQVDTAGRHNTQSSLPTPPGGVPVSSTTVPITADSTLAAGKQEKRDTADPGPSHPFIESDDDELYTPPPGLNFPVAVTVVPSHDVSESGPTRQAHPSPVINSAMDKGDAVQHGTRSLRKRSRISYDVKGQFDAILHGADGEEIGASQFKTQAGSQGDEYVPDKPPTAKKLNAKKRGLKRPRKHPRPEVSPVPSSPTSRSKVNVDQTPLQRRMAQKQIKLEDCGLFSAALKVEA